MIKKKNLSEKNRKAWEDFIKNPSDVYDKEKTFKDKINKARYKFDLHGFALDDANKKVKELIFFGVENEYDEILFITGKGIHSKNENDVYVSKDFAKLKFSVPEFIKTDQDLSKYVQSVKKAGENDGGDGALIVKLKKVIK